ncbi:scavenger receptor class F member 2 isoform X2 [Carettochelys insculpta]|uniref:scavenger receptor class F member 2 isoform X2 n=1 Tax=Carettochelys insculpta TaxID=44489 RepID=UPI003EBFDD58
MLSQAAGLPLTVSPGDATNVPPSFACYLAPPTATSQVCTPGSGMCRGPRPAPRALGQGRTPAAPAPEAAAPVAVGPARARGKRPGPRPGEGAAAWPGAGRAGRLRGGQEAAAAPRPPEPGPRSGEPMWNFLAGRAPSCCCREGRGGGGGGGAALRSHAASGRDPAGSRRRGAWAAALGPRCPAPEPPPAPEQPMEAPRAPAAGLRRPGRAGGALLLLLLLSWGAAQELSPRGRNVCRAPGLSGSVCCPGWRQQGVECLIAVCEGNFTCKENEVCVRPSECRCRHGYFGANCDTKCPRQFWGPDCKEMCSCHPNGQCEDVTGQCTCNLNRWGPKCENACLCKHGKCDQKTGKCTCEPNWWGPQCSSSCYCSLNSQCDQQTGTCICQPGWWGRGCNNQCSCNNSPCEQFTGRCQCRERTFGPRCDRYCQCYKGKCNQVDGTCTCEPGYRGKYCREPCPAGFYGQGCRRRCGQCKGLQPCTIVDGRCLACEAGWNGTKCDQACSSGFYGDGCEKICPPCKDGHTCNHINGKCSHCNPGWIGDRCEAKCRNGTYGENCAFVCSDCFNGECHFETGRCLCRAGSHGTYCNLTCPAGQYGINCAESCSCHDDTCDPLTGACHMEANQRMGVIAAGALLALLLILLLSLLCCCCVCRKKEEAQGANQDPAASKKSPGRLCGRFSRISMKLPRIPLHRQKLPKVVESLAESKERGPACSPVEKLAPSISAEEAGEYTFLKETGSVKAFQADSSETPLLKSSDSERSSCGSGSTSAALYAKIARLSKQSKEEDENALETKSPEVNGKSPSPERTKPPPPDPSTKPKVSWIHGKYNSNQSNSLPAPGRSPERAALQPDGAEHTQGLAKRKRSPSETSAGLHGKADEKGNTRSKEKALKHLKELSLPEGKTSFSGEPQSPSKPKQKTKASSEQLENINGAVQNALKKMGTYHSDRKGGEGKEVPRSPSHSKPWSEAIHPHLSLEAATLLAAQLKEKTQSLNRGDGSARQNGVSSLQSQREKPTPPQKAKRSVATSSSQKSSKPALPTSPNLQKLISPVSEATVNEAKRAEKQNSSSSSQEHAPLSDQPSKKTPIKKPPRKKSREATLEQPKATVIPPQTVQ